MIHDDESLCKCGIYLLCPEKVLATKMWAGIIYYHIFYWNLVFGDLIPETSGVRVAFKMWCGNLNPTVHINCEWKQDTNEETSCV